MGSRALVFDTFMEIVMLQIDRMTQIKVRKILQKMRYHDAVRYSGPIYMLRPRGQRSVYMGEDYEIRDRYYGDWDSEFAFLPKSKTRKNLHKIVGLLHSKNPTKKFLIGKFTYTQSLIWIRSA
jgi:hypothetical protein